MTSLQAERFHRCETYATTRMARAYSHILIPPDQRHWWHRLVLPKTEQHFCGKCEKPLRHLDARYYTTSV
jgi:hypothetical protein